MNSLGVYLLVSLSFVLATMFEFAIVLVFKQIPEWKASAKVEDLRAKKQRELKNRHELKPANVLCDDEELLFSMCQKKSNFPATHKIDITALFVFSVLYLLFNLTYWFYV